MKFNIYAQVHKELDEFFTKKVHIAGVHTGENARYLGKMSKNYEFSQHETINLIDLYYNSKFKEGELDSEGQRKIFLNVCRFRSDVASKQIDLDTKDFLFVPEEGASPWPAYFMGKEFKVWAKDNYFGELLNTWVEKFPKYGWVVAKKIGGKLTDVPIQTLRNQQDAESLNTAKYVIIEHPKMTLSEMEEFPDWDTSNVKLENDDTADVYERYGKVPLGLIKQWQDGTSQGSDWKIWVDAMAICTAEKNLKKIDDSTGALLFIEQVTDRGFEEAHWSKQHGRLMGIGEIENQFENQVGANMSFNLYRRQLLWSSKKVFQSKDEGIAKNLVRDVKDGTILQVGPNGEITQVDMGNRAGGDFANFQQILEKNSDQKSFTYEVATGASLPSGTPFRLGVVLSNAVNSHFDLKREKLGLFIKRALVNQIIPTFKRSVSKEHIIEMYSDEEGFEALKQVFFVANVNDIVRDELLNDRLPDLEKIKADVMNELNSARYLFVKAFENFYDNVKYKVVLTVTGEEIDLPKKIETLTNLYTQLAQKGDPRAERVLKRVLSLTGENFDVLAGPMPQQQLPAPTPTPNGGSQPSPFSFSTLNQPSTENKQL